MRVACVCVCVLWRQTLSFWQKCNDMKFTDVIHELRVWNTGVWRSRRLDSGSAIMEFSQITVITLVVVILGFGSVGNQKVLVSITDVPG